MDNVFNPRASTSTDVEPVSIIGSELLVGSSLDKIDPSGDLELTSALQVSSIGNDELLGVDITNGDSSHLEISISGSFKRNKWID